MKWGRGGGRLFKEEACLILRPRRLFGGGCLLEHRHLFEEIRLIICHANVISTFWKTINAT